MPTRYVSCGFADDVYEVLSGKPLTIGDLTLSTDDTITQPFLNQVCRASVDFYSFGSDMHIIDHIDRVVCDEENGATIVFWTDNTKTVTVCQTKRGDTYNKEMGLAMCIVKKMTGNKGNFNDIFKKFLPEEY